MWLSSGRITTPILAEGVVIDSGPLGVGPMNMQIFASSNVNAAFEVQWRDAANATTLKSQVIAVPAFTFAQTRPFLRDLNISAGERIRVVSITAITGAVSVSLDIPL
jgi:hypothetical protein